MTAPGQPASVHETSEELAALDELLARSFDGAGEHLTGIISPKRRLDARDLCRYLVGIRHLVVATTTHRGEPRCSAVDGLFFSGSFWFSTSASSLKATHLEARPAISAAHVVGDQVGVFVHGVARVVRGGSDESRRLSPLWREVYGSSPEDWMDDAGDARYVQIVATRLYTYAFDREQFEQLVAKDGS